MQAQVPSTAGHSLLKTKKTCEGIEASDRFKNIGHGSGGGPKDPKVFLQDYINALQKSVTVFVMEAVVDGSSNRFGEGDKVIFREAVSEVMLCFWVIFSYALPLMHYRYRSSHTL